MIFTALQTDTLPQISRAKSSKSLFESFDVYFKLLLIVISSSQPAGVWHPVVLIQYSRDIKASKHGVGL